MDDDNPPTRPEPFTIPVPPPLPGGPTADVFFFRRAVPPGEEPTRDSEDIMLRKVPPEVAMKFRAAAGGRGMTHAQYLAALVGLHEAIRMLADDGDDRLRARLQDLGLQTVSV